MRNLRASATADELSLEPKETKAPSGRSLRGRPPIASLAQEDDFVTTESVSSAPTPFGQTSESDYSTPGTSKLPSPAERATVSNKRTSSALEVHIPARSRLQGPGGDERALRRSIYSLNSTAKSKKVTEVEDTDEEADDFSGSTRDAQVARHLQNEEYRRASLRPRRTEATDTQSSVSAEPLGKRPRSLSGPSATHKRPTKKSRIIPDSDDLPELDVDMDAEIAAGLALADDQSNGEASSYDEEAEDQGEDEIAASSDDEPLTTQRQKARPKRSPVKPEAATRTSANRAQGPMTEREDKYLFDLPQFDFSSDLSSGVSSTTTSDSESVPPAPNEMRRIANQRRAFRRAKSKSRTAKERDRLEKTSP